MAKLVLFDVQKHIHSGPRLWQRQATRKSAALSGWSLPRIFKAVSCLEALGCRCRRLRGRLFVLSGDSWHLSDFRRLEGLNCLPPVRFTGCPCQCRAACTLTPARPRSLPSPRRRHSYLPGRASYPYSSNSPAVFRSSYQKQWILGEITDKRVADLCAGDIT